jgi:hypothetical protein
MAAEAKRIAVCRSLGLVGLARSAKRERESVKSRGLLGLSHRDAQPTLGLIELELKEGTALPLDGDRLFEGPLIEALGKLDFERRVLSIQSSHARCQANVASALLLETGFVKGATGNLRYRPRERITGSRFRCLCFRGHVSPLTGFVRP